LSDAELALYQWVMTSFLESGPPSTAAVRSYALDMGLSAEEALALLAREDLMHLDSHGEIAVAYPFSGRPTRHRVVLNEGRAVWAMCAIDALGMAAMLGTSLEVHSTDPLSGDAVTVSLEPAGTVEWDPIEAVVLAGSACTCAGPSYQGCCDVLNFFSSRANAERYLADHPQVEGHPITIPDAVAAGTAIFGEVLNARE
jgi:hypothetical protein